MSEGSEEWERHIDKIMEPGPEHHWIEPGDNFTIAGVNRMVPDHDRRWWQFWKPRMVDSGVPMVFEVKAAAREDVNVPEQGLKE